MILAQAYLTFAYEPGRDAPDLGVAALITGFVLFTLGVFGRNPNGEMGDALSSVNIAVPKAVRDNLTPAKVIVAARGGAGLASALNRF